MLLRTLRSPLRCIALGALDAGRNLALQFGSHARVPRRSLTSQTERPGMAPRLFAWDLALRRWRLIWQVFSEQLCEEGVRCHYGNVVVGEADEVEIARDEVVGVRGADERKEVVIVGVD